MLFVESRLKIYLQARVHGMIDVRRKRARDGREAKHHTVLVYQAVLVPRVGNCKTRLRPRDPRRGQRRQSDILRMSILDGYCVICVSTYYCFSSPLPLPDAAAAPLPGVRSAAQRRSNVP
jgi:hypothetical protein